MYFTHSRRSRLDQYPKNATWLPTIHYAVVLRLIEPLLFLPAGVLVRHVGVLVQHEGVLVQHAGVLVQHEGIYRSFVTLGRV
ncbi:MULTISPECIES: hypothetical protein [unclassified Coleofasciculus]|uniref:hypothetical protein n=1 Tax=unclassified Coleofasciculus TaxID=2692782 RepID=UPI0018816771|nr:MULTISPECIES: hypothetical protein [unclassified Coleofasciculus]MBE9124927.1 hypothetical protein [Coleofasciculus sp. LEGE 07081]MBE9147951.1 hypothetical protein [Coleofasciculus sp. LEGE 07092]